jgi:hypothetical protein
VCLSVAAPGFQYYVDQRLPEFRIGDATFEVLRDLLESGPSPPVLWHLSARNLKPSIEFDRLLRENYVQSERVQLLKTSVERWEHRGRQGPVAGGK